ncbi:hypothetical protein SDRG_14306 [Saprolegnia diclina VS20]|uniref:U3 small nucleolar RNA-associated protein 14 n=1 Tax=Saprolegnia diclina (strain VS20) TaxID=1156394 RepID=T0Q3A3_SAPDV|nr:hypothetical protein SDRG_14306 [Saprolegnia diclina VS20]EQC27885.1 hypothetical protein SDRG_14306 [Saprolegnia diclina VS20]|eukprot:XP_008618650.1 hypothetical protein SDRG_14306 [Saprolegnia diclina VS20]
MAPRRSKKGKAKKTDVYEHDDDEANEAREAARMEIDGVYEYEAPAKIARDDDSEIDEDGAFDSEDDATFGSFFSGGKTTTSSKKKAAGKKASGKKAADSDDEATASNDEDDDDEAGGDLLSDMLGTAPAARLPTADDEDEDEDDEDDDDDETKHASLMSMVDAMAKGPKRKIAHAEMTEDVAPSAFSKKIGGAELTLASLMASSMPSLPGDEDDEDDDTKDEVMASGSAAALKRQFAQLEADDSKLSAPLAPVLDARASRKVAYDAKKKDLDVFVPVVQRNRQKETLDFRMQGSAPAPNITVASLTTKFKPEKPLENDVAALLATSGWSDKAAAADEAAALEMNALSTEEVQARQKELAKMRVLMFYEEQKARRVKKIKSKLYHKIRNKQDAKRERSQLRELDPELADQLDLEDAEKRAEERMTLKHNNTSKWVKHQLGRGIQADAGTRQAIHDQLRRGDELRRKMDTVANESDLSSDDDSETETNETETQRLQRKLAKKASALVMEITADAGASKADGLHGMKFMQKAVEKQRERALNDAEKLLQELRGDDYDDNNTDDDDNPAPAKKAKKTTKVTATDKKAVAAKMVHGSQQMTSVMMDKAHKTRVSSAIQIDFGDSAPAPVVLVDESAPEAFASVATAAPENPWLDATATKKRKKPRNRKKAVAESATIGSAIASLATTSDAPATGILGPSAADMKKRKAADTTTPATKKAKTTDANASANTSATAKTETKTEAKTEAKPTTQKKPTTSSADLAQEELVRRAFAFADEGDDEIGAEKDRIAAEDGDAKSGAEVAKLTGMTGWGSWAGEGVKTSKRQLARLEQAKAVAAAAKLAALSKRKDAKLSRVLINEKKDKKAAKFMVASVPYPFTSREQYELAMRNPLGADWNTTKSANALTAPEVMLRAGQIIQPLVLTNQEKAAAKTDAAKAKSKATKAQRKAKF